MNKIDHLIDNKNNNFIYIDMVLLLKMIERNEYKFWQFFFIFLEKKNRGEAYVIHWDTHNSQKIQLLIVNHFLSLIFFFSVENYVGHSIGRISSVVEAQETRLVVSNWHGIE